MDPRFYPSLTLSELTAYVGQTLAPASPYYLQSLAMYASTDDPRFAAIFLPTAGKVIERHVAFSDIEHLDDTVQIAALDGFYPVAVTATMNPTALEPWVAMIVEKSDPSHPVPNMHVHWSPNWPTFSTYFDEQIYKKNCNLLSLDACVSDDLGEARSIVALVDKSPTMRQAYWPIIESYDGCDWSSDPRYDAGRRGWGRPAAVVPLASNSWSHGAESGAGIARILTLWMGDTLVPWPSFESDDYTGGVFTLGPNGMEIQADVDGLKGQAWPIHVGAKGNKSNALYCVTMGPVGHVCPLQRRFVAAGPTYPKNQRIQDFGYARECLAPVGPGSSHSWTRAGHHAFNLLPTSPPIPRSNRRLERLHGGSWQATGDTTPTLSKSPQLVLRLKSRNPWSSDERSARERPRERVGFFLIPVGSERMDDVVERVQAREGAPSKGLTGENPKPDLHLIEPAAMERCEHEGDPWMAAEPRTRELAASGVDVVGDHDDGPARVVTEDPIEECENLGCRSILGHVHDDMAGLNVERGEDVARAMPPVFEFDSGDRTWTHGERGVPPRESLYSWLLVDAQDDRLGWWSDVEFADGGRFRVEIGVGRVQPVLHSMWLQRQRSKEAAQRGPADEPSVPLPQVQRHVSNGPSRERQSELRRWLYDERRHLLPHLACDDLRPPASFPVLEPIESVQEEPLAPTPNDLPIQRECCRDDLHAETPRREQDHLRTNHHPVARTAPAHHRLQPTPRLRLQTDLILRYRPSHPLPLLRGSWPRQPRDAQGMGVGSRSWIVTSGTQH